MPRVRPERKRPAGADPADLCDVRLASVDVLPVSGGIDARIVAAFETVQQGVSAGTAPTVVNWLRLPKLLAEVMREVGAQEHGGIVSALEDRSTALRELIEVMRIADELIEGDIGISALTRLLTDPPVPLRVQDAVVLLGRFAAAGDSADQHLIFLRWNIDSEDDYTELQRCEIQHVGSQGARVELVKLAAEFNISAARPRTRALVFAGPQQLASVNDPHSLLRNLRAAGAVAGVEITLLEVPEPQNLNALDRAIAQGGHQFLIGWIGGEDQWAWRRMSAFEERGRIASALDGATIEEARDNLGGQLAEMLGNDEDDNPEADIPSPLSAEQQAAVRAAVGDGITLVFVGGNETQFAYRDAIEAAISDRYSAAVTIRWHGGWGSNWQVIANAIKADLTSADAVVVMTYVRTGLGRQVRRDAGRQNRPWISCTGRGRQTMCHALERALAVIASV